MENETGYTPMRLGDWMLTLFLTYIPIVNIVMLCVWAFSMDTHPSKASWAKATLIWILIGFILALVFWGLFGMTILGMMGNSGGGEVI